MISTSRSLCRLEVQPVALRVLLLDLGPQQPSCQIPSRGPLLYSVLLASDRKAHTKVVFQSLHPQALAPSTAQSLLQSKERVHHPDSCRVEGRNTGRVFA